MKAKPQRGLRAVGGASPQPWEAPAAEPVQDTIELARALSPADAVAAAMSWHVNQAITRLVGNTFAAALHSRRLAEAVAAASEQNLPAGPLRSAVTRAANGQIAAANATADLATAFGRRFGHLAFAFSRPGAL